MGDIAEAMIGGDMCEQCGEWIGDGDGYPRACAGCGGYDDDLFDDEDDEEVIDTSQRTIAALRASGLTNPTIARRLGISVSTVKKKIRRHREQISAGARTSTDVDLVLAIQTADVALGRAIEDGDWLAVDAARRELLAAIRNRRARPGETPAIERRREAESA